MTCCTLRLLYTFKSKWKLKEILRSPSPIKPFQSPYQQIQMRVVSCVHCLAAMRGCNKWHVINWNGLVLPFRTLFSLSHSFFFFWVKCHPCLFVWCGDYCSYANPLKMTPTGITFDDPGISECLFSSAQWIYLLLK